MAIAGGVVVTRPPSARVRVSLAIADAFMCLSFAMLWLFFVAFATMVSWGRTCGEECHEFQVWKMIASLSLYAFASANAVVLHMLPWIRSDSGTELPPEKELRPHTVLGDSAFLGYHVLGVFVLRTVAGDLLKGFSFQKGSPAGEIGSAILDGGALAIEFLYCFVVIPTLALRTRKMSRIRHGLDNKEVL